jgi:CheY-like chemotaxis protein
LAGTQPETDQGDGKTILLVEDDETVRILTADVLRMLGHIVIEASDATDALNQILNDLTIDYLFTDIIMPNDMNGVQLMMKARELRPELNALLASGYPREILRSTADLPDNVFFLQKPYSMTDLMAKFGGSLP